MASLGTPDLRDLGASGITGDTDGTKKNVSLDEPKGSVLSPQSCPAGFRSLRVDGGNAGVGEPRGECKPARAH